MESIDPAIFIGTLIIAVVEVIKYYVEKVSGAVTIIVAGLVGLLVGVVDVNIGVVNVSPAKGLLIGLSAAGVVAVAAKVSSGGATAAEARAKKTG